MSFAGSSRVALEVASRSNRSRARIAIAFDSSLSSSLLSLLSLTLLSFLSSSLLSLLSFLPSTFLSFLSSSLLSLLSFLPSTFLSFLPSTFLSFPSSLLLSLLSFLSSIALVPVRVSPLFEEFSTWVSLLFSLRAAFPSGFRCFRSVVRSRRDLSLFCVLSSELETRSKRSDRARSRFLDVAVVSLRVSPPLL